MPDIYANFIIDGSQAFPLYADNSTISTSWSSVKGAFNLSDDASEEDVVGRKFFIMIYNGDSDPSLKSLGQDLLEYGMLCEVSEANVIDDVDLVKVSYDINDKVKYLEYNVDERLLISDVKFEPAGHNATKEDEAIISKLIGGVMKSALSEEMDGDVLEMLWNADNGVNQLDILAECFITKPSDRVLYFSEVDIANKISTVTEKIKSAIDVMTELGLVSDSEGDGPLDSSNLKDLKKKIDKVTEPKEVCSALQKIFKRLKYFSEGSAEYGSTLNYIDTILDVPWGKHSSRTIDINNVISLLEESHYGLDDVKEYIVEYIAVEKITKKSSGNVLCFIGDPGCGKTSFAKQIAKATNREVIKIAVGGMSDEAEFRGHRRTYIAAMPGRIVNGLIKAKTMDPLFIIDEVDKISSGRGNPTAALLEILDPEQNSEFVDRFLGLPVDLSKASFICTANYKEQIPPALLDRMEVVNFRTYTSDERSHILKEYIVQKAVKSYNLEEYDISFSESVLDEISKLTKIRKMETLVRKLLRRACVRILKEGTREVFIDKDFSKSVLDVKSSSKNSSMGFN